MSDEFREQDEKRTRLENKLHEEEEYLRNGEGTVGYDRVSVYKNVLRLKRELQTTLPQRKTKLLMRLNNSQGLHLICVAPEVDEVTQAIKREFANYSSLLRVAFDNEIYGQDYASDNSFSGLVHVYFNTLFCGTPKAMRRMYPDVENGLVSRVLFVTVPDQVGKPMPIRSMRSCGTRCTPSTRCAGNRSCR